MGAGLHENRTTVRETREELDSHSPAYLLQKIVHIIHTHSYLAMQSALLRDFLRRDHHRAILLDYFLSSKPAIRDLVHLYQPLICFFSKKEQKTLYHLIEFLDLDESMDFSIRMEVRSKIGDLIGKSKK